MSGNAPRPPWPTTVLTKKPPYNVTFRVLRVIVRRSDGTEAHWEQFTVKYLQWLHTAKSRYGNAIWATGRGGAGCCTNQTYCIRLWKPGISIIFTPDHKGRCLTAEQLRLNWHRRWAHIQVDQVNAATAEVNVSQPGGHYTYRQFNTQQFYVQPRHVFVCFMWISEQTAIISLNSINWLVCITETECLLRGTDWVFIYNSTFCPHSCIYVFCVDLRTNSDYFPIQH